MPKDEENGSKRRADILLAAQAVFHDCGYAATTMEAVAEKASISKGSIYNYFQNKHDLFKHVFISSMAVLEQEMGGLLTAQMPARDKLERIIDYWYQRQTFYNHIGRLMLEFWATAARQDQSGDLAAMLQGLYTNWRQSLTAVLVEGVTSGEFGSHVNPAVAASLVAAIMDGIQLQSILDSGLTVNDEFVAALKRAIMAGLTTRPANPSVQG